jgi:hypothetical protein
MRRFIRAIALAVTSAVLFAPTVLRAEEAAPTPTPVPPLIERVGLVVPEVEALQRIRFRPFLPGHPVEVALLAPFHTEGISENPNSYGIAFAYVSKGHTFVMRQWPKAGGSLATFSPLHGESACTNAYLVDGAVRDVRGVGWETSRYVFTLLPDDKKLAGDRGRALKAEWHRLALRGACR